MRKIYFLFFLLFYLQIFAQEPRLAYQYFRNGAYEKAVLLYKELHQKHPYNTNYVTYLIKSYRQTNNFEEINKLILKQLNDYPHQNFLLVELGYNYQLQHVNEKANALYKDALSSIENNPSSAYLIGKSFQENHLLQNALKAYKRGMQLNTNVNFNFQIAAIYGEMAEMDNMFNTYLDMVAANSNYLPTIKNFMGRFISDDSENSTNITLKKLLIKRVVGQPKDSWNKLLSWLYIQEKEYAKAFIQEKALHKRNPVNIKGVEVLGDLAFKNGDLKTSQTCFRYILENTSNSNQQLNAQLYLLEIEIQTNVPLAQIHAKFSSIFSTYGKTVETLNIQLVYATFLAFKLRATDKGIQELKNTLQLPLSKFDKARIKIKLADIYVFSNKFNTALIYYTQVQNNLKNHEIAQQARFKIAQTSYFKGDFTWAQSQLGVLKNSTSQLIANDALDLNLLITDNTVKDSLKLALKTYAVAELLALQNKNLQAIDTLTTVLTNFKGHPIEDEALFKQAKLYEKTNAVNQAENNYLKIIEINRHDILADDAHYYLAELYLNKLLMPEKAKEYYQKIIFEYPSSIYLVGARKKFRKLRGDVAN